MTLPYDPFEFLDTEQAGDFTKFSPATLVTLRSRGGGPKFYRVNRQVRYLLTDLREWMMACPVEPKP